MYKTTSLEQLKEMIKNEVKVKKGVLAAIKVKKS